MEFRQLAGRLLLISVFFIAGCNLVAAPHLFVSKLVKATTAVNPLLKDGFGFEMPLEDIKLHAKLILEVLGGVSVIGALLTLKKFFFGYFLLSTLTFVAILVEVSLMNTEPLQKTAHLFNLFKVVGVLGGLFVLCSQTSHDPKGKQKID